jgi:peptide/nickel transport system permease protein
MALNQGQPAARLPGADGTVLLLGDDLAADEVIPGISPYRLAARRLRRDRTALGFGCLFLLIVAACLLAPVYSHDVAHIGPNVNNVTGTIQVGGHAVNVVSLQGIPIGPTWHARYFFGADTLGRDVAVRLLYGGRTSLAIGFMAAAITMVFGVAVGLVAGYYRGAVDGVLARLLDIIWAYPAVLLGVAIGTSLALGGLKIGPLTISGNSIFIPAFLIGFVYIPYVAKPIRGQVLALREREFVDAARGLACGNVRIMVREILPNLSSTIVVFFPLIVAGAILLEASLSFLGAGVQPPNASWGTMIQEGLPLLTTSPQLVLVPGGMLVLTVLGINVFGEGVRDALDPKSTIRLGR